MVSASLLLAFLATFVITNKNKNEKQNNPFTIRSIKNDRNKRA